VKQFNDNLNQTGGYNMKHLFLLTVLSFLAVSCSVVGPGDLGVRLNSGEAQPIALNPGMHFYFPVFKGIKHMTIRVQKTEVTTGSASKDLQDVDTVIAINWR